MAPTSVQQTFELALQHHRAGRLQEADDLYRQILSQDSAHAGALHLAGLVAHQRGRDDLAVDLIRKAIVLNPASPEAHVNLGNALRDMGQLDEAVTAYREAIALNPKLPEAHNNLGNALRDKRQPNEALAAFSQAIALRPRYAEAHGNIGSTLRDMGRLDEAIAAFREAIVLNSSLPGAFANLGNALKDSGQLDDAIAAYRQAVALNPTCAQTHSNLLLALLNHSGYDAAAIAEEHRAWSRQHAEPLRKSILPHDNDRDPDRRLRVGYVSRDFYDHAVSRFLPPLFRHHDRAACRIICYSDVSRPDAVTERLRACVDEWHNIVGLSDERVAAKIRQDKIDILVDLAGHTAGNRLLVFARKPAPVQITYLGYPATTGLSQIDYRLTDAFADPPGETESLHSEKLWRLPNCNWCFAEPEDSPPVRTSRADGPIHFGTFNNLTKASPFVMDLWAAILKATPSSRLIFKSRGLGVPSVRSRIIYFFESRGVQADRLDLRGSGQDTPTHLDAYNQMDISLDTFPYHGTTTTCDALWMGVPVVTLAGKSHISRVSVSLLSCLGLSFLVAQSHEEYVSFAVRLANDLPRLADLHRTLRDKMRASPLMDAPKFARNIEAAYRRMWHTWCQTVPNRT
jgi:protein O-GlcNAc transferase